MKLHKILLSILLICSVCFSSLVVLAAPETNNKQNELYKKYNKQNESYKKYNKIIDDLGITRGVYPDFYSGAYLNDDDELVILTTNGVTSRQFLSNTNTITQQVEYSLNELNSIVETINNYLDNHKNEAWLANFTGFGIDEKNNKVLVSFKNLTDEAIREFEDSVVKSDAISYEERSSFQTNVTYLGSQIYYINSSKQYGYSMGFRAKRTVNGTTYNGFVTAGHNMKDGVVIYDASDKRLGITKGVKYGSTADASFVYADSNTISSTTINGFYINGSDYAKRFLTGYYLTAEGYASGFNGGQIISTSYNSYQSGILLEDTILADFITRGGDSGGIVYLPFPDTTQPAGIISAGNDTSTVICKVQRIIDALGVTPY
ncbi:MAG: flagellar protein FlaG [Lacrimispora celerecrescens]|nr:flagellar protein FlaG [Lacrimispora celerecrescens]